MNLARLTLKLLEKSESTQNNNRPRISTQMKKLREEIEEGKSREKNLKFLLFAIKKEQAGNAPDYAHVDFESDDEEFEFKLNQLREEEEMRQ